MVVIMWNIICVDTFASYATMVSDSPGCIANRTEYLKKGKYVILITLGLLILRPLEYLDLKLIIFTTN